MFTLEAADLIEGDAEVASKVDFTINGVEETSGAITIQALGDGQLANAKGTIYTVPASTTAIIKSITLVNTDSSARTVNLYLNQGGTSRRITPIDIDLAADGGTLYVSEKGIQVYNAAGLLKTTAAASDVVDDTTPQLGGDLDVNAHAITNGGTTKIELEETANEIVLTANNLESLRIHDSGIIAYPLQSAAGFYNDQQVGDFGAAEQIVPTGQTVPLIFDTENFDNQGEWLFTFDTETGHANSTGSTLVATNAVFDAGGADNGKWIWNLADNTYVKIVSTNSTTSVEVTPNVDDTWDGDAFVMYESRFLATETAIYMISATLSVRNLTSGKVGSLIMQVDNGTVYQWGEYSHGGTNTWVTFATLYELTAGEYLTVGLQHDEGSDITLIGLPQTFNIAIIKVT